MGDGYAGQYIPEAAHYIWEKNQALLGEPYVKLRGIAMGNGLTAPALQYAHYAQMINNNSLSSVDGSSDWEAAVASAEECAYTIGQCQRNGRGTDQEQCKRDGISEPPV